jgi:hypothetical protein
MFCALAFAGGCVRKADPTPGANLLAQRAPIEVRDVSHPERLTDGRASFEGDHWLTDLSARLGSSRALVVWDLGQSRSVRCALVQGDSNDFYKLAGSADGTSWQPLWTGDPANGSGMRLRQGAFDARARYVRLSASGGDGMYSVGEVALFAECPAGWPEVTLARAEGIEPFKAARSWVWTFAAAAMLFIVGHRRGGPRGQWALLAPVFVTGALAISALAELYPFANSDEESLVRAIVALLAGALVVKEAFVPPTLAAHPRVARLTLGVLAVVAVGCYYHFGAAQFQDAAKGRRTVVHTWDMRHYFPTAKYFKELRFDGLYLASLAAYVDLKGGITSEELRGIRLRDLTNYEMVSGTQAEPQLAGIRARFSPERWEEFKRDMNYFVETMGPRDYLGSMRDHGGNATPVWLLGAWLIFMKTPASEWSLGLAGAIDPLLLLLFFVVLYRSFGLRVMLYTAVLFGATDFYQFGSNLMGSTLRQDWLVAVGLGACALKKQRPFLGGALLAYGGLIRAFPAIAAMFLAVPLLWWGIDRWRETRRGPSLQALRSEQAVVLRALAGVAAAVVAFVLVTAGIFGLHDAWGTWIAKIEMHAVGPSTNNVGLRNLLSWRPWTAVNVLARQRLPDIWLEWDRHQIANFAMLKPLFYLLNAAAAALALLAARRRPLHETAVLGLLLIPFLFYPSNYYCHFIFLLPMAFAPRDPQADDDRTFGGGVLVLAAICFGQYLALEEGSSDLRYTYQTMVLLGGFSVILVSLGLRGWRELRGQSATVPAGGAAPIATEG